MIAVGDTPSQLTIEDFVKLGELSEGLSGSDIEIVVQDALLEPVRNLQDAYCFTYVNFPLFSHLISLMRMS